MTKKKNDIFGRKSGHINLMSGYAIQLDLVLLIIITS